MMHEGIVVDLFYPTILQCAQAGAMRRMFALRKDCKPRFKQGSWTEDINGCLAEAAACLHYGKYWDGSVGETKKPDCGRAQVRSKLFRDGHMVIHPSDADDEPFICVLVRPAVIDGCLVMRCEMTGWLYGHECKKDEFLYDKDPPGTKPRWFVPDSALRPMSEEPPI